VRAVGTVGHGDKDVSMVQPRHPCAARSSRRVLRRLGGQEKAFYHWLLRPPWLWWLLGILVSISLLATSTCHPPTLLAVHQPSPRRTLGKTDPDVSTIRQEHRFLGLNSGTYLRVTILGGDGSSKTAWTASQWPSFDSKTSSPLMYFFFFLQS
jgi:hypothetical protein